MKITLYQLDAFTHKPFAGNPAAVCPLQEWLSDNVMQAIAAENNLSETAFIVPQGQDYQIRWFTPVTEVKLCGHATLASAFVVFNYLHPDRRDITFHSKSGPLMVKENDTWLELDFPSQPPVPCDAPPLLLEAFSESPSQCLKHEDYILVFDDPDSIVQAKPDLTKLRQIDLRAVCITAKAKDYDFVSRFFAPKAGIDEDPVTGSSFCRLIPYWSDQLGKKEMLAKQVSPRGGEVRCLMNGDRVGIAGKAAPYLVGEIEI